MTPEEALNPLNDYFILGKRSVHNMVKRLQDMGFIPKMKSRGRNGRTRLRPAGTEEEVTRQRQRTGEVNMDIDLLVE